MNGLTLSSLFALCFLNTILAVTGPWPSDPNTVADCYSWIRAKEGDDCISLADKAHVAVNKFIIWNPSLLIDCDDVIQGNGYCMGSGVTALPSTSSTTPPTTSRSTTSSSSSTSRTITTSTKISTTATTTTTTSTGWPTPSSGTASNCITFAYFRVADTCDTFVARYASTGLTKANLIRWNTLLQSDCSGLSDIRGHNVCIAINPNIPTTTTTTSAWPTPSSGTASNCITFAYFRVADTCDTFVARYTSTGLTKANLIRWNTLLQSDCSGLSDIRGHNVCIAIDPNIPTTTTTTSAWPTPSFGTAVNCITFAYFRVADTCDTFVTRYASTGLTKANLILWNTLLLSDCSGLSDIRGHNICIAIDPTMTITTTTTSRTSSTISTPSPLMPGGCVDNCDMWYHTSIGDYCAVVIAVVGNFRGVVPGLTRWDLRNFNPGLAPYCPDSGSDPALPFDAYVCIHTPGWQPQPSSTSSSTASAIITPLPTQSGMVASCTSFYRVDFGEFCDSIVDNLIGDFPDLTISQLVYWNPAVGPDCGGIQRGTYLCIQGPTPPVTTASRSSTTSSRTTTTSSTSTTAFTYPTPSSGTAPNCIKLAYFRSTDTCDIFVARYATSDGLTKANLILWNTLLLPDCSGLGDIRLHNVCIAVSVTTHTTSSRTTTTTSRSTTTTAVTFTRNPSSFPSASTAVCVPTTTTPVPPKITGGATLNTAITTACQQLIGSSGSFFMDVGNPYKTTVVVGGRVTQFLIQIRLGGFSVTQSLCVAQFQAINTKCTSGSPGLTPGGCFYTSDANMETCIFTS